MVATLSAETEANPIEETRWKMTELLRPDVLVDGHEPEARVVSSGLSWTRYLALDKELGDDRPGPRLYYLDGELEIMTTSGEHERIINFLGGLMDIYFDEQEFDVLPRGQATMRLAEQNGGAEPDLSWCIDEEKMFPDLVVEIALTSGGVRKLELYRRFGVPEVWIWRDRKLEIYVLVADGNSYARLENNSRLFPGLDVALLEQCAKMTNWREARKAFRAGLAVGR